MILSNKGSSDNKELFLYSAVIIIFCIILLFFVVNYYNYASSPIINLDVGSNLLSGKLYENEDKIYLAVQGVSKERGIANIDFVFKNKKGDEFFYSTDKSVEEILLYSDVSFLKKLFGIREFKGVYHYEISSGDLNLTDLKEIKSVSISFIEYCAIE